MVDTSHTPIETVLVTPAVKASDGWKSRKLWVGIGALAVFVGLSFAMLFVSKPGSASDACDPIATSEQVIAFWQLLVPSVLVPLFTALGYDKKVAKDAAAAPPRAMRDA